MFSPEIADKIISEFKDAMLKSTAWKLSSNNRVTWGNDSLDEATFIKLCPTFVDECSSRQLELRYALCITAVSELNQYWLSLGNRYNIVDTLKPKVNKIIKSTPALYNRARIKVLTEKIANIEIDIQTLPHLKKELCDLMVVKDS